ncbi:hypothetical protein T492DRAFT_908976 [Pavlovales sp. CCMP2436]|nr:hypothetical protein T492DRAFT_908976 [Pavlovales sp. CCMP2436]
MEFAFEVPDAVQRRSRPRPARVDDFAARSISETERLLEKAAQDNPQLRAIKREVEALGAAQLMGRSKKAYDSKQLSDKGFREQKGIKIPLPMLSGMKRKREERADKAEANAQASATGELSALRKARKQERYAKEKPRELALNVSVGVFSNGVLKIGKSDVDRMKSSASGHDYNTMMDEGKPQGGGEEERAAGVVAVADAAVDAAVGVAAGVAGVAAAAGSYLGF